MALGTNAGTGGDFVPQGDPQLINGPDSETAPVAVDFDGTDDYLERNGSLTGLANGKDGLISVWLRVDGGANTVRTVISNANLGFQVQILGNNTLSVRGENVSSTVILSIRTVSTLSVSSSFVHFLASWQLGTTTTHIYLNDVSDLNELGATNDVLDYAQSEWFVGRRVASTDYFDGPLSELFFTDEYLDLSVTANRRKFIDANGAPVFLGNNGELPTGNVPDVYMFNRATLSGVIPNAAKRRRREEDYAF